MTQTPRLGLPYLQPNQAQKHVTLNDALRRMDTLVQLCVISAGAVLQPESPAEGDTYILPEDATGTDWAAAPAGAIAAFVDGGWQFVPPQQGLIAFDLDQGRLRFYTGSAWRDLPVLAADRAGINAEPDAVNRLAVKSDAELLSHDDVTPGSGDARKIINKAGAGQTASVLFQSAFTGHAEFGLTGDNDFHLKVSADGDAWLSAVTVSRETGAVGLGVSQPSAPVSIDTRAYPHLGGGAAALLVTGSSGAERAEFRSIGPGPNAAFQGYGARGTPETPEATLNGDRLFAILGSGHDGTGFVLPFPVQIDMTAEGDWTSASHGGAVLFRTTAPGTTTAARAERMRITGGGDVGIGTASPSCRLHVEGPVRPGSYGLSGLPSAAASGAGAMIYVADATGGAVPAFSDGANWRRVTDRTVVD